MKRYLVFSGDNYYPCGGWFDFKGSFNTKEEILKFFQKNGWGDWCQVVDSTTGKIITGEIIFDKYLDKYTPWPT